MTRPTCRVPRWASIARRMARRPAPAPQRRAAVRDRRGGGVPSDAPSLRFERRLQAGLGLVVERGLDHLAAVLRDTRQDLVRRALADQHHDRGAAVLEVGPELLMNWHSTPTSVKAPAAPPAAAPTAMPSNGARKMSP